MSNLIAPLDHVTRSKPCRVVFRRNRRYLFGGVSQIPRQLTYCRFPLNDGGGNDPKILLQTLRTTTDLLNSGIRTIVACSAGMSRSPAVAAFALAHHLSETPDDVIARIAEIKSLELKSELWNDPMKVTPKLSR